MSKLVILRGLPGCGKSTRARAWVKEDPDHRAEVNRDSIRMMLGGFTVGSGPQESMVTKVSHNAIKDLLKAGVDVACSDTNLRDRYVRELMRIAVNAGADVQVIDMTDVPLETCLERNRNRKDKAPVPDPVIRKMYQGFVKGRTYPLPVPDMDSAGRAPDFYVPVNFYGNEYDISDIDGTVASCEGIRSPYDYSLVSQDRPRRRVIDVLESRHRAGKGLIFVSGRPDIGNVREDTERWLRDRVRLPFAALYMRPGDRLQENDAIIKRDLFDTHIRGNYNLSGVVFDDRDRVVRMWREQLGLDCLQVNYGDF